MNRSTQQWMIVGLTIFTAIVHLALAVPQILEGMMGGWMFVFNGLGYLALLAVYLRWVSLPMLKGRETLVAYAFMGFALITIVGYFAVNGGQSFANPIGLVDKAAEVGLMALIWIHSRSGA